MNKVKEEPTLTEELKQFIMEAKESPGNLITVLHKVQKQYRYIPRSIAFEVADIMEIPVAKVYGVITFYHAFKLEKPGKHNITICMGTACYLKGAEDIVSELEKLLGIGVNEVTDDGEFSLELVRCVGCCGLSPVMVIDGEVHGKLKNKELPGILAKYKEK